jgi:hypothetical protein
MSLIRNDFPLRRFAIATITGESGISDGLNLLIENPVSIVLYNRSTFENPSFYARSIYLDV